MRIALLTILLVIVTIAVSYGTRYVYRFYASREESKTSNLVYVISVAFPGAILIILVLMEIFEG